MWFTHNFFISQYCPSDLYISDTDRKILHVCFYSALLEIFKHVSVSVSKLEIMLHRQVGLCNVCEFIWTGRDVKCKGGAPCSKAAAGSLLITRDL